MGMFPAMTINTDTLKISPEILSLIAELDEFKGAWRAFGMAASSELSRSRALNASARPFSGSG